MNNQDSINSYNPPPLPTLIIPKYNYSTVWGTVLVAPRLVYAIVSESKWFCLIGRRSKEVNQSHQAERRFHGCCSVAQISTIYVPIYFLAYTM